MLAGVVALVYYPTLSFKYCIDDQYYLWLYIEDGSTIREYIASLTQRFWLEQYRPVTFATILFEALAFGKDPGVHHGFNLIYYSILCFLVFLVVKKFFKNTEQRSYWIGLVVALFFLLHPSHANVVSSIKNREAILSMTFGLLSMYTWWKFLDDPEQRKIAWLFVSAFFLFIGLMAKTDIFPFLLLIPLTGYFYTGQFKWKKEALYVTLYTVLVLFLYISVLRVVANSTNQEFYLSYFENPIATVDMTMAKWLPYSAYILSIYEKFMVWPTEYYFYFGFDQIEAVTYWNARTVLSFMGHLLAFVWMVLLWKRKQFKYLFGPAIFFLALLPFAITRVSGIVSVRYSFIASLGFCLFLVQLFWGIRQQWMKGMSRIFAIFLVVVICGIFAFFSRERSLAWKDIYTLYATDLPHLTRSVNANRMAGLFYYLEAEKMEEGVQRSELLERSVQHADQALGVYPSIDIVLDFKAKALHLLGREAEALEAFELLIELDRTNIVHLRTAAFHAKSISEYELCTHYFEEILKLDGANIEACIELTQLYIYYENWDRATKMNDQLFKSQPYDALLNYGDIQIASGDTSKALDYYYQALSRQVDAYILEEVLKISDGIGDPEMSDKLRDLQVN